MSLDPTSEQIPTGGLRRELRVVDAAAFSVGLIGPVGAMALLGVGAAGILGHAAPWAFIFAILAVVLVGYGFIKLSRYISHTGSVYALVGRTLGPRAGFVAGAVLVLAYAGIGTGSTIEIALFFDKVLAGIHLVGAGTSEWIWSALIALIVVVALSVAEVRVITKVLLYAELIGAVLVTVLSVVILVKAGTGHAPAGQHLGWDVFRLAPGTNAGTIAEAAVFGFLAFAGFEGAAALGEETMNPKHEIPRALKITIAVVGSFFLLTIIAQAVGYGATPDQIRAFSTADDPYGDLGTMFMGHAMGILLDLMASLSLFAITLGTVNGAARVLLALLRDAGVRGAPVRLTSKGSPIGAISIIVLIILCDVIGQRSAGSVALTATYYWLTLGTVALLVTYAMATLGSLRFLFFSGRARAPRWQMIIPILAFLLVLYTIYKNSVGVEGAYRLFPWVVLAVIAVATAIVHFVPGLAARVRAELGCDEEIPDDAPVEQHAAAGAL